MHRKIRKWTKAQKKRLVPQLLYTYDDFYIDEPKAAPFPFVAHMPQIVIENLKDDPEGPHKIFTDDPLAFAVYTPHGTVLRLEYGACKGIVRAETDFAGSVVTFEETVYGALETLEAIGATNITLA